MYKIVHFYITFFVHSYIIINTKKNHSKEVDDSFIKSKQKYLDNYVLNAIVNYAQYKKITDSNTFAIISCSDTYGNNIEGVVSEDVISGSSSIKISIFDFSCDFSSSLERIVAAASS